RRRSSLRHRLRCRPQAVQALPARPSETTGRTAGRHHRNITTRQTSVVERREREAILKQGVTRPETPRDRREREALDEDMRGNPLAGAPLRRRLRNFRPDAGAQLAALGGPLAWMRRLRTIELAIGLHEAQLAGALDELRAVYGGAELERRWREVAEH